MAIVYVTLFCFFFFKQKTAYEMRISDWSSDVCSSDLLVRRLSQGEGLPADLAGRLAWQRPYPAGVEEALRKELRESHCGLLPEAALGGMLKVQRLWDAWMADSMLAAAADGAEGAVLIAGSGHVREDRAVPWHLGGRGGGDALTLALVEVAAGSLAARDYAAFDRTLFD